MLPKDTKFEEFNDTAVCLIKEITTYATLKNYMIDVIFEANKVLSKSHPYLPTGAPAFWHAMLRNSLFQDGMKERSQGFTPNIDWVQCPGQPPKLEFKLTKWIKPTYALIPGIKETSAQAKCNVAGFVLLSSLKKTFSTAIDAVVKNQGIERRDIMNFLQVISTSTVNSVPKALGNKCATNIRVGIKTEIKRLLTAILQAAASLHTTSGQPIKKPAKFSDYLLLMNFLNIKDVSSLISEDDDDEEGGGDDDDQQALQALKDLTSDDLQERLNSCLLYTSPSPRDGLLSRMPSSA